MQKSGIEIPAQNDKALRAGAESIYKEGIFPPQLRDAGGIFHLYQFPDNAPPSPVAGCYRGVFNSGLEIPAQNDKALRAGAARSGCDPLSKALSRRCAFISR